MLADEVDPGGRVISVHKLSACGLVQEHRDASFWIRRHLLVHLIELSFEQADAIMYVLEDGLDAGVPASPSACLFESHGVDLPFGLPFPSVSVFQTLTPFATPTLPRLGITLLLLGMQTSSLATFPSSPPLAFFISFFFR